MSSERVMRMARAVHTTVDDVPNTTTIAIGEEDFNALAKRRGIDYESVRTTLLKGDNPATPEQIDATYADVHSGLLSEEAERLGDVLVRALPGGVIDALVCHLLARSRSSLVVSRAGDQARSAFAEEAGHQPPEDDPLATRIS